MGMAERVGKDAFLRQQTAIMGRPDSRADLPGITSPTLVLCGREDALSTLEMHVEMADLIPAPASPSSRNAATWPPWSAPLPRRR